MPDKASGGFSEGLIEATEGEKVTVQIIGETLQYTYIHLSFLEKVTYIIRELAKFMRRDDTQTLCPKKQHHEI